MTTQKHPSNPAETSTELEFIIRDHGCFFIRASAECECQVKLEEMVHGSSNQLLEFFTVDDASPNEILTLAHNSDSIEIAKLIRETNDKKLFEFEVSGPCVGETLADAGAVIRNVAADDGVGRVSAYLPPHIDKRPVINRFRDRHGGKLVSCREMNRSAPEFTRQEFRAMIIEQLTDRQFEVLQIAHASGYYAWPRESSAKNCADLLGISQPTFTQHLRMAQAKLLNALFTSIDTKHTQS